MRKWSLLAVPLMLLAAVAIGCGGGGKKTIKVGDTKIEVGGSLPSDFPKDFPIYKGAKFTGSFTSSQQGITGTAATWETGDSVEKVKGFFDNEFKDGAWKSTSSGTAGDTAFWVAESSDGKKAAYVGVSRSGDKTSVVVTVGDKGDITGEKDASPTTSSEEGGSADTPEANATLPAEVKLSSDFPKDRVPLPSGARITSASSLSSGGTKTFYLELYVKDTPQKVNDYFKEELPKHDWTDAFTSESNGEFFMTFSGASAGEGPSEGVTVTIAESETAGYSKVSMSVTIKEG